MQTPAAFPPGSRVAQDWSTFSGDVSADGRLGYTFGSGLQTTTNPDGSKSESSALFVAASRRRGWQWRLEAYMWSLQRQPPGSPPPGFPLIEPDENGTPRWAPARRNAAELLAADTAFAALSVAEG